ncbi:MAG: glycosyltransferase family 39 protein [Chloroflexi bacterium]|nr:glycosyltransferase family 39 protein [Chloroflexota bacterium]
MSRESRPVLALLAIILLGNLLRIFDLGSESLWLDEATSVVWSQASLVSVAESSGTLHNQPPLYFALLHFWMLLFGTGEIAARSLSAIFGIISVFLIYQVGCRLFNRRVGLISSFLSAISYYYIYYSQEARAYSLLLLLTLLSFFFFITILKAENTRKWHFPCYFLCNLFLAYTHVYALFVIASQVFYFLLFWGKYRRLRSRFLGVQIATAAFFSPWIPTFLGRVSAISKGFWISEPSSASLADTIATYIGSGWGRLLLVLVFSCLCLMGLFAIERLSGKWALSRPIQSLKGLSWNISLGPAEEILLLLVWFAFPIVIPFFISQVSTPIYFTKYTIGASPALYLLAARGMSAFNKKAVYALLMLVAALSLPGLRDYYAHDVKEQWREVAAFIENDSQADDVIVICASYCQIPFDYYYRGDLERFGIDPDVTDNEKIAGLVDKAVAGKRRMWLVLSHQGEASVKDYLIETYGRSSLLLENRFVEISVCLFDLRVEGTARP